MTSHPPALLAVLQELEEISARLRSASPQDPEGIVAALAGRRLAIGHITEILRNSEITADEELLRRLEEVLSAGRATMVRITLDREDTRTQISYVNQELHWLRTLRGPEKRGAVDHSG